MARKWAGALNTGDITESLQCDRATNGAEIMKFAQLQPEQSCFNVTAPRMARKCLSFQSQDRDGMKLQCDRATNGAEMKTRDSAARSPSWLQCDRATNGAEMVPTGKSPRTRRCFNVTAPRMARK